MARKLTTSERRAFVNRYLDLGRNIDQAAEEYGITLGQAMTYLSSDEAKDLVGELGILEDTFAAFAKAELGVMFIETYRRLTGQVAVPQVAVYEGNIIEFEAKKFFPADVRALLSDMAKMAGLLNVKHDVNVSGTIEYRSNVPPSALNKAAEPRLIEGEHSVLREAAHGGQ